MCLMIAYHNFVKFILNMMFKKTAQSAPSPLSPTIFPFWLAFASSDLLSASVFLYHLHRFRKYTIVQTPAVTLLGLI